MVENIAMTYPDRFAPITMHVNNDGYDIPWGQHRLDSFYGLAGAAPTFMVDAVWNAPPSDYQYYVEQQLSQPAGVTVELSGNQVTGSTWDVTARVCSQLGGTWPMRIFTAATLNHHPQLQRYSTNVLMQKVEEADISLDFGECSNVTSRITFDSTSMANSSNIVIIAWAQEPGTTAPRSVHQAGIMRWPFPAGSQLTTIEVTPSEATLNVGDQVVFIATGYDQHGATIPLENPTWTLGPTGSGTGLFDPGSGSTTTTFTATTPGARQIFCTDGAVTGGALITINESPRLTSIEIDPSSTTVDVDGEIVITAMGKDQYGEDFPLADPVWSISGTGDGTFDPTTGNTTTFTASYPGTCVVTCTQDDLTGTAEIEVVGEDPRLATLELDPTSAEIRVGDEIEFTATGSDQYGRVFELSGPTWRIEGDGDGVFEPTSGATTTFTAGTEGTAQLICSEDGVEGSATVEIAPAGLPAPRKAMGRVSP